MSSKGNMIFNNTLSGIKKLVEKDKKKNLKFLLGGYSAVFIGTEYYLTKTLYSLVDKDGKNLDFIKFVSSYFDKTASNTSLPTIRNIIFTALLAGTAYLAYKYVKTPTTFQQSEDLGSAKIGDKSNLAGLTGNDGLLLSKTVQLSEKTSFEHLAIVGPTGSGKSSTFFIPNLLTLPSKASMIITDPKGGATRS